LASIESQLRGQADFNWRREGLRCKISVPLCNAIETVSEESHDVAEATITGVGIVLEGGSIMLVEDEVIVALAVSDSLADLGFSVIGPFTRVSDACRALTENRVDAAILDVNLDGEMVYALAKMLDDRKIPFVFATGYGSESIEPGFEHIPVLQKPIERDMLSRIFVLSNAAKNSIQKATAIALPRGETASQPVV
jgi:chemotaxis family two-component system sensor kinase Cph1